MNSSSASFVGVSQTLLLVVSFFRSTCRRQADILAHALRAINAILGTAALVPACTGRYRGDQGSSRQRRPVAAHLIAAEPDIVTPIGLAIDGRGRLFVVESHTHFPPTNYPGPKYDRVKLFQDTDGDGKPDKATVFAEGLHHTMNLAFAPDGQLYAVHRNGVVRLDGKDGDGLSESRATILEMETPGNYPHNGLSGITFSPDGWLYVGWARTWASVTRSREATVHRTAAKAKEETCFAAGLMAATSNCSPPVSGIHSGWRSTEKSFCSPWTTIPIRVRPIACSMW
jgi:hypothetical protein